MSTRPIPSAERAKRIIPLVGLFLGHHVSSALEIRSYSAERHDRFTGFPEAPAFNDSAYYGSRSYTGAAWIPGEANGRQFALVTPRHVVFALHYAPGAGTVLRFLNSEGVTVDRTVTGVQNVLNGSSEATDLCLVRLSEPLGEADKVAHFPYLNLASESAYTNTVLTVFGWEAKAGRGTVNGFEDSAISGMGTTRLMRFRYRKNGTNQDDARVVLGDSGSPTFATVGGTPALVGVHTAAGESTAYYYGYDSFVPHYIGKLDDLLESDGYRMTPVYPPAVALSVALATPSALKQGYAGTCRFDLSNTGANDAGNARMTLHFPAGQAPDTVTADGWIFEEQGPQDWVMRRANLAAGAVAQVVMSWAELPAVASVPVEVTRVADGSPKAVPAFDIPLTPTFKVWAEGLEDETQTGDPDEDGVTNLVEYAFGGDPESGEMVSETGEALLPVITIADGQAVVTFPVRDDGVARGLTYTPEFSEDLVEWSSTEVPALTDGTAAFDPEVPGFGKRTISWDASDPRRFFRVRVTLDE